MNRLVLAIATILVLLFTASAQEDARLNPVDTITRTELKNYVYFLASDEMGGRVIYTENYIAASKFCARQFHRAGLKPLKNKKEEGIFLHEVPFVKKTLRSVSPLSIYNGSTSYSFDATVETRYLFQEDVTGALDYIEKTMKKFSPSYYCEFQFFDETFNKGCFFRQLLLLTRRP